MDCLNRVKDLQAEVRMVKSRERVKILASTIQTYRLKTKVRMRKVECSNPSRQPLAPLPNARQHMLQ